MYIECRDTDINLCEASKANELNVWSFGIRVIKTRLIVNPEQDINSKQMERWTTSDYYLFDLCVNWFAKRKNWLEKYNRDCADCLHFLKPFIASDSRAEDGRLRKIDIVDRSTRILRRPFFSFGDFGANETPCTYERLHLYTRGYSIRRRWTLRELAARDSWTREEREKDK